MMAYSARRSLRGFQKFIEAVYGLPDDRHYSVSDLHTNQQRYTMRALKGMRRRDAIKLKKNLLIAFSWMMAVANRFHIDVETHVWERFPNHCSYCGRCPCVCLAIRPKRRRAVRLSRGSRPRSLAGYQQMFGRIYPASRRTLSEAGVHLAEEMGEVSEAIILYRGEHRPGQFSDIQSEIADYVSCIFGVANSASIDVASELAVMYRRGCHVCHHIPCRCNYVVMARFDS